MMIVSPARFTPRALRQVATRCLVPNSATNADRLQSRTGHIAREALSTFKIGYLGWLVPDSESVGTFGSELAATAYGAISIKAAIEYPAGVYTQVLFSGSPTLNMSGTGVYLTYLSDDITVSIPANATFAVRTFASGSNVLHYMNGGSSGAPIRDDTNFSDACSIVNDGSLTDNTMGGAYGTDSPRKKFGPSLILANTSAKAAFILGDSRSLGYKDTADTSGDLGNIARSVGQSVGYTTLAVGGMAALDRTSGYAGTASLLQYFTHAFNELGYNDINQSRTSAQIIADQTTIRGYLTGSGRKVGQLSIERGSTVGNAVNANNAGGATNQDFYCDTDSIVMPGGSPLSGGWDVDNVHESQLGYVAIKTAGVVTLP